MKILLIAERLDEITGFTGNLHNIPGFSVETDFAKDVSKALNLIGKERFDVIMLDLSSAGQNSPAAVKRIKLSSPGIPLIVLGTSNDSNSLQEELFNSGIHDYLPKENLSPAHLLHSIHCAVQQNASDIKLREMDDQLRLIARHSPIIIFRQDLQLRYTWVNSPFLGFEPGKIIGATDNELFPAEDALVLKMLKKQVIDSGSYTRKIIRTSIYGKPYFYDLRIEPDYDPNGHICGIICTALDVTEKKSVEKEFQRAKNLLEKIFNSLYEAVFVIERDTRKIIACNPAVERIFGYKQNELIGRTTEFLHLDHEHFENFRLLSQSSLHSKGVFKLEYRMKRRDNVVIDTEHTLTSLRKSKGWDEVLVSVINDITERKKAENALIFGKEMAERSDRLKTEFLAQMSHEIRTPINVILSYSKLLSEDLDNKNEEEIRRSIMAIDKAGKRIIRTVDLILNMSEIQTGNYNSFPMEIDLYLDILLNLYLEFRKQANDKSVELELLDFAGNSKITADEYSVSQIFRNLIENAIKYTSEGKITIVLNRDDNNRLVAEIRDTGIGISEDYLTKLFIPFSQEDQSYTRPYEGNGLGLALVKKYVELNHATIDVQSHKGEGSVFRVIFE
ncbi:MAG: PAS domain S-box protein [Ignavibacteriales bacterium]